MKDPLDDKLRKAREPLWSEDYWKNFPEDTRAKIGRANRERVAPIRTAFWKPVLAVGVAVMVAFVAGLLVRPVASDHWQVADAERLIREIAPMFPDRIRWITVDANGMRIEIADSEMVPNKQPILVQICRKGNECETIITFSGQRINIHGTEMEALVTAEGSILLVGEQRVWSSAQSGVTSDSPRLRAKTLEVRL